MKESQFVQLVPKCRVCNSSLVLNLSLIEYLVGFEDVDAGDSITLDDILGTGKIQEPKSLIPVAYDTERKAIVMIGWCLRCNKPMMSSITLQELLNIQEGDKNE